MAAGPVAAVGAAPAAVAFAGLLLLAGCMGPGPTGSGTDTGAPTPPVPFDGAAAHAFVAGLVGNATEPRFRVPGTASHDEAAQWLHDAMQVPGWTFAWQNFTGAEYQAMPKGGVQVYTKCDAAARDRLPGLRFSNLVARWDAPGDGDRAMAFGAHWESKRYATQDTASPTQPVLGANDGASGVGILLQLMRHVAAHGGPAGVDLRVVLFDGEDGFQDCHPLAGSIAFVQGLAKGDVDRMLLLDMVGDPDARFIQETNSCDAAMASLVARHAPAAGLTANFPGTRASISDDHLPFAEAGIPAYDLIDAGRTHTFPPYWHTTHDTLDKVDAAMLGRVGDLLVAVLADPDFTGTWPAGCVH